MPKAKKTFVVGRSSRHNITVVVLRTTTSPILGPWTLKAVVSAN